MFSWRKKRGDCVFFYFIFFLWDVNSCGLVGCVWARILMFGLSGGLFVSYSFSMISLDIKVIMFRKVFSSVVEFKDFVTESDAQRKREMDTAILSSIRNKSRISDNTGTAYSLIFTAK